MPVLFYPLALFYPILLDITTPTALKEYKLPRVRRFKSPAVPQLTPLFGLAAQHAQHSISQHCSLYQHRLENHKPRKLFFTFSVTSSTMKSGYICHIFRLHSSRRMSLITTTFVCVFCCEKPHSVW